MALRFPENFGTAQFKSVTLAKVKQSSSRIRSGSTADTHSVACTS